MTGRWKFKMPKIRLCIFRSYLNDLNVHVFTNTIIYIYIYSCSCRLFASIDTHVVCDSLWPTNIIWNSDSIWIYLWHFNTEPHDSFRCTHGLGIDFHASVCTVFDVHGYDLSHAYVYYIYNSLDLNRNISPLQLWATKFWACKCCCVRIWMAISAPIWSGWYPMVIPTSFVILR